MFSVVYLLCTGYSEFTGEWVKAQLTVGIKADAAGIDIPAF
jgi:hypothetical protein